MNEKAKLTISGATKEVEQLNLWYISSGNVHGVAFLERVAVSYKVQTVLKI